MFMKVPVAFCRNYKWLAAGNAMPVARYRFKLVAV
jgi:hypothetical protein